MYIFLFYFNKSKQKKIDMNALFISESNSNVKDEQSNKIFETFIEYKKFYTENELDEINVYIIK